MKIKAKESEERQKMNDTGRKIKSLRQEKGMTQKELADKLFVTPQAVSRWENDGIEPPIDMLKKLSAIFDVTIDELLNNDVSSQSEKEDEKSKQNSASPSYGICDSCHNLLQGPDDIHDIVIPGKRTGRHRASDTKERFCSSCYEKYLQKKKQEAEAERRLTIEKAAKRRKRAFIIGPLCAIAFGAIFGAIIWGVTHEVMTGIIAGLISSLAIYPMFGCLFLMNNPVLEILYNVSNVFFVKWPGVIFSLDWDGLAFLIVVKILFAILGFIIGALGVAAGVAIASVVALFVFIPSIFKSIKNPADTEY